MIDLNSTQALEHALRNAKEAEELISVLRAKDPGEVHEGWYAASALADQQQKQAHTWMEISDRLFTIEEGERFAKKYEKQQESGGLVAFADDGPFDSAEFAKRMADRQVPPLPSVPPETAADRDGLAPYGTDLRRHAD